MKIYLYAEEEEGAEGDDDLREPLIAGLASDDEGSVGSEDSSDGDEDELMPPPLSELTALELFNDSKHWKKSLGICSKSNPTQIFLQGRNTSNLLDKTIWLSHYPMLVVMHCHYFYLTLSLIICSTEQSAHNWQGRLGIWSASPRMEWSSEHWNIKLSYNLQVIIGAGTLGSADMRPICWVLTTAIPQ